MTSCASNHTGERQSINQNIVNSIPTAFQIIGIFVVYFVFIYFLLVFFFSLDPVPPVIAICGLLSFVFILMLPTFYESNSKHAWMLAIICATWPILAILAVTAFLSPRVPFLLISHFSSNHIQLSVKNTLPDNYIGILCCNNPERSCIAHLKNGHAFALSLNNTASIPTLLYNLHGRTLLYFPKLKESTIAKAVFVKKQIQPIFQALGKAQENEISWGKYKVL